MGLLSAAEGSILPYVMESNLAVSLSTHTHSHNKSTYSLYTIETQHMNTRKFARHVTTALLIIEIILQNKRSVQKNKWIMKR